MHEQKAEYLSAGRGFAGVFHLPEASPAPRPGVMVLHGGAGPGAHEHQRAQRLAELGYLAFVPDLFGEAFTSREHGMGVIMGLVQDPARLRLRAADALGCLRAHPRVDTARLAAVGFCFGGLAALELARSGADARAVVSFHGGLKTQAPAAPGAVKAAILVCTGAADPFVPREDRQAFEDEMTSARADWQMCVYADAMHGFTESGAAARRGADYHAAADRRSWAAMRGFFDERLA